MKRYFLLLAGILSFPCFAAMTACPQAEPVTSPNFCSSFKAAAICHCSLSGLPPAMCQNMDDIYARMVAIFGTAEAACGYQHDTAPQLCVDDWHCYRSGGLDSNGNLCSSTGNRC